MNNKTRVAPDVLETPYRTEDNIYMKEVEALREELKEAQASRDRLEKSYKYEEEQRALEQSARNADKEEYNRSLRNPRRIVSLLMLWVIELVCLLVSILFLVAPLYCVIRWHMALEILWVTLLGMFGIFLMYVRLSEVNEANTPTNGRN